MFCINSQAFPFHHFGVGSRTLFSHRVPGGFEVPSLIGSEFGNPGLDDKVIAGRNFLPTRWKHRDISTTCTLDAFGTSVKVMGGNWQSILNLSGDTEQKRERKILPYSNNDNNARLIFFSGPNVDSVRLLVIVFSTAAWELSRVCDSAKVESRLGVAERLNSVESIEHRHSIPMC